MHLNQIPYDYTVEVTNKFTGLDLIEYLMKYGQFSRVRLFATPWTVAHQALPSMGFSRQATGVGCHFLLQRIFLTQGSNPSLLH